MESSYSEHKLSSGKQKSYIEGNDSMKKGLMTGIMSGALIGGLLLGSVGLVSAAADDSNAKSKSTSKPTLSGKMLRGPGQDMGKGMKLDLTALVDKGIISQDQSTAIQAKMDQLNADRKAEMTKIKAMTAAERQAYMKANKPAKVDLMASLVDSGVITSAQVDAIKAFKQASRQQEMKENQLKSLTALVEKGTITADQSNLIVQKMDQAATERQAEMDKVKDMTPAEAQAYFKANPREKTNPLADLVTAGSLTQAQADAVRQALHGGRGPGGEGRGMENGKGNGKGIGMGREMGNCLTAPTDK